MAVVTEEAYLSSLDDLTGKVALVTGGAGTIGSQAAAYLAARGCLVYVADTPTRLAALQSSQSAGDWGSFAGQGKRVDGNYTDRLRHHVLDLASVATATESATALRQREGRLDIIVAAAAAMDMPQDKLNPDGWERTWAITHLGHVTVIKELLPLLEQSATPSRPSRIVFISSNSYESAKPPDYALLRETFPNDFAESGFLLRGIARYQVSKLCNVYYASELSDRLAPREGDDRPVHILVNCCHPGINGRTHLANAVLAPFFEALVKGVLSLFSHTPRDCAKTGVYMAASAEVRLRRITGEFWTPRWSWWGYWTGCYATPISALGQDLAKRKECWEKTEGAIEMARKGTQK